MTFKDEADVLNVVADLLEVMVMFDSSVQLNVALKQGRGGDANSWQRLAERRAETLKEHLVKAGRSEETPWMIWEVQKWWISQDLPSIYGQFYWGNAG